MVAVKVEDGRKSPPPKRETKTINTPTINGERAEAVQGIFQLTGLGCIIFGQYADAGAISMHSPPISYELAALAEKNASIARGVDLLLQVGPYAGLVAAAMPLVMQILVNHKILKPEMLAGANVVPPEVLESQVKSQMAQQAMDAIRKQREAEADLKAMQEEFEAEMAGTSNGNQPAE